MTTHDSNSVPSSFGSRPVEERPRCHAAVRALERYGIDLSLDDVRALAKRCNHGEGFLERDNTGAQRHTFVVDGRVIWVVYRPPGKGKPKDGLIVTITPPDARASLRTTWNDMKHKWRRIGAARRHR